jgi:hypothetical protein
MWQDIQSRYEAETGAELRDLSAEATKAIVCGAAAFPPIGGSAQTRQIEGLIKAGAWTDAALAMIRIEAPEWTVRRIEIDDGEWFCSLSRHPAVPQDFDDRVEGRHRLLPIAILAALTEARRQSTASGGSSPSVGPRGSNSNTTAWCDNCR